MIVVRRSSQGQLVTSWYSKSNNFSCTCRHGAAPLSLYVAIPCLQRRRDISITIPASQQYSLHTHADAAASCTDLSVKCGTETSGSSTRSSGEKRSGSHMFDSSCKLTVCCSDRVHESRPCDASSANPIAGVSTHRTLTGSKMTYPEALAADEKSVRYRTNISRLIPDFDLPFSPSLG